MNILSMELTVPQLLVLLFSAFLGGFSKTGIIGLGIIITPLMASVFPAGRALGFLLPVLFMADITSIVRFNRQVPWKPLLRAIPWGIVGTVFGWLVARLIVRHYGDGSDRILRLVIGSIMGLVVALGYYVSRNPSFAMGKGEGGMERSDEVRHWYAGVLGLFSGFAGMLTNSGGPVWATYFSSLDLEVKEVIGAGVWCLFIITFVKMPFSVSLGFMNAQTLAVNLLLAPLTVLGMATGSRVAGKYSKKAFARIIRTLAACGAVYMIVG